MTARCPSRFVAVLAMGLWLAGCGGGGPDLGILDLGGGLGMAADGTILDTARPAPAPMS